MSRLFQGAALVVPLSFFPTLARAAFLSYFLMFLSERFELSVDHIGLFVGGFILLSSVFSLVSGPLLDRMSVRSLLLTSSFIQSSVYAGLLLSDSLALVFILCLVLNLAYLSLETAVRMCIARQFPTEQTASVLSFKYTLTNTAYALGPLIGLWLNKQSVSPLLFCSIAALVFVLIARKPFATSRRCAQQKIDNEGLLASLAIMAKDRKLLKFTIASILLAAVFGQFHLYVGQYLLTTHTAGRMYEIINAVFVTNALTSILLQYLIGRRVTIEYFRLWTCVCVLAFFAGLLGFAFSSTLLTWILFTVLFTVGEIIIQPLEFLYITRIAPPHMTGAYYSSQNLTYLGAASTPVVCGFILAACNPMYFFLYLLALLMAGGAMFYNAGGRLAFLGTA
ncbi:MULTISPECIES: MFS transporter [Pseudomonas]|uniref:MFS transporter n=1 Tax=Pseudomonas TaxID=286 RepID=UPI001BEBD076|nr:MULTISPECIES: MFS transporter [Pseudomonas]MBT2340714.1 MFS transporter [Pseudomonas fluorescens]MCD4528854.1 MFS transporter [Pseudomonas sp. C3-2018]